MVKSPPHLTLPPHPFAQSRMPASTVTIPQRLKIASVLAFYMVAALVMVFINKAVLLSTPQLPILFVCIQLATAVVLLHVAAFVSDDIQIPAFDSEKLRALWPLIAVTALGLVFNTLCLRDVDVSFFMIARGLVLPLTIAVSGVVGNPAPQREILVSAMLVTAGFVLGVLHSPPQNTPGWIAWGAAPRALLYGFFASLAIATHASLIPRALPLTGGSAVQLAYWTNAGSLALLAPLAVLSGEPWTLQALASSGEAWNTHVFVVGSAITGVVGFLLCIAALLSVRATSPVSHMFSSAARSVLQTLFGVWLFNDVLTFNRLLSILTITAGTVCYTWLKSQQPARTVPEPPASPRGLGFVISVPAADDEAQALESPSLWRSEKESWF